MTTIALGDDITLIASGAIVYRLRVNPANNEIDLLREDTANGETWVMDTQLLQSVVGMERSRSMRLDWLSLDSENPFTAGGVLDTATLAVSRHVPGRVPVKYDAGWALVGVGDDNAGGVKNQQYGAWSWRIWNPSPDTNGNAQGELRSAGNGFVNQGWMGQACGNVLTDAAGKYPAGGDGGYLGFGTWNIPGGYFVNGNRIDRQTVNLGSADIVQPGQTRFYGPGFGADYATGAYFLTSHVGYLRNFVARLPGVPGNDTATIIVQRQYADAGIQISLSGNAQQGFSAGGLSFGPGEAIGVKLILGPGCNVQGGFACSFDYGA